MDISEIKKKVELLQAATLQRAITVKDTARELGVRTTELMQYILDNPKLFHTEETWSWKTVTVNVPTCFGNVKEKQKVKDKCLGLGITDVYLKAEDNFRTDEHVEMMKTRYAKTVWLTGWDNYGEIEGHYVREDMPDDRDEYRKHLWRNTADKIAELESIGALREKTFYIGGAFDCSEHKVDTAMDKAGIEKAESCGWTIL